MAPGIELEPVDPGDDDALGDFAAIHTAATPEDPESVANLRWASAAYPGGVIRFLARLEGRRVGAASTGRVYVRPPEYERFWLELRVLPDARGRGVGRALFAELCSTARAAGKTGFDTHISETQVDGLRFLARHGFVETSRMRLVELDLRSGIPAVDAPPPGIGIVTLAERPELAAALHAVAVETFPDIPVGDGEPISAGTQEEFLAQLRRPDVLPGATSIAIERGNGRVVGYASVHLSPGSTRFGWHDMTAVVPAWRGRGVATALKQVAIAGAARLGVERLETTNDEENVAMRAVNRRLGFVPGPDVVELSGPVAPAP